MRTTVFLDYDQEQLDRAYDQRAWADNADAVIAHWRCASAQARETLPHQAGLRYGPGADETLDLFLATKTPAPIHVHIHGGAWRSLSKDEVSFAAPAFVDAGIHFVALNFSLLPQATLPQVVAQLMRAMHWIHERAPRFGGDRDRITLSGHSSGAHLAAVLLTQSFAAQGLPAELIKAGLCISGLYDLDPVLLSARRSYVKLTVQEADALSPQRHVDKISCPVTLIYGEKESPEFIRQPQDFARALNDAGKSVELITVPKVNHFEIMTQFSGPDGLANRAALRQISSLGFSAANRTARHDDRPST